MHFSTKYRITRLKNDPKLLRLYNFLATLKPSPTYTIPSSARI